MRIYWGLLLTVTACGSDRLQPSEVCDDALACLSNADCRVGEVCAPEGCCQTFDGPTLEEIAYVCQSDPLPCSCQISGQHHLYGAPGGGTLVASEGESVTLQASLHRYNGTSLDNVQFGITVSTDAFAIEGHTLRATTMAGPATITAGFGSIATCSADAINLGPLPTDGTIRVSAYHAQTGIPVSDAQVIVDWTADGMDDGAAPATDAYGIAQTTVASLGRSTITVFHQDFDYTTISVNPTDSSHVYIPMHPTRSSYGGISGRVDLPRAIPGGTRLELAIVSQGLSAASLSGFGLDSLLGGPQLNETCDTTATPGCYSVNIPYIYRSYLPIHGGVIITPWSGNPWKSHFDVRTPAGTSTLWGMGGSYTLAQITPLFDATLAPAVDLCGCDVTPGSCESTCSCDTDCFGSSLGRFFRGIVPLLSTTYSGRRSISELESTSDTAWNNYVTQSYDEELRANHPTVALLDDATAGRLSLGASLAVRADINMPPLPMNTHSIIAITGHLQPGSGFIPRGFGAAFDCTGPSCTGSSHEAYDGALDPISLCAQQYGCPFAAAPMTSPNTVAVLHEPLARWELWPWRTVAMAIPTDHNDLAPLQIRARLLAHAPRSDSPGADFPPLPSTPVLGPSRTLHTQTDGVVQTVLRSAPRRWFIYGATAADTRLPSPPVGLPDPLGQTLRVFTTVYSTSDADVAARQKRLGSSFAAFSLDATGFATLEGVAAQ